MNDSPIHRALRLTAWIAGMFCLLLCAVMLYEHFAAATNDPWKSPQLLALKDKLAADPKSQALQTEIRLTDQKFRQRFRLRVELDRSGGWLLLGGMLVFVLATGKAAALKKALPSPLPKTDADESSLTLASRARGTLVVVALVVAGSLVIIRVANTSALPADPAAWQKLLGKTGAEESPAEPLPALADFQANWPRFRGWDGSGATAQTNFVTNIAWRSAVLAPGHSRHDSPPRSFLLQRFQRRASLAHGRCQYSDHPADGPGGVFGNDLRSLYRRGGRTPGICHLRQRRPRRDQFRRLSCLDQIPRPV